MHSSAMCMCAKNLLLLVQNVNVFLNVNVLQFVQLCYQWQCRGFRLAVTVVPSICWLLVRSQSRNIHGHLYAILLGVGGGSLYAFGLLVMVTQFHYQIGHINCY